jgi:hypothetical protein
MTMVIRVKKINKNYKTHKKENKTKQKSIYIQLGLNIYYFYYENNIRVEKYKSIKLLNDD